MSSQMKNMTQRQSGIAIVRLSKGNTKLEIACYKNKVLAYREGIETRLDEVLQSDRVFINVHSGEFAANADITYVIGKKKLSEREVAQHILDNGVLQVAQGERGAELEVIMKDICTVISQKCVNKVTKKPFPAAIIEQSLKAIGVTIRLDDSVKKQALQFIKALEDSQLLPIERALMKVRCSGADPELQVVLRGLCAQHPRCELLDSRGLPLDPNALPASGPASYLFLMEPHLFRDVERLCASVQVIESSVMDISEKFLGAGVSSQVAAAIASPNAVMAANAGFPAGATASQRSKPSEGTSSTAAKPTAKRGSSVGSSSDDEADNKKTGRQKAEERKLKRQQKKAAKNAAADDQTDNFEKGNKKVAIDDFSDDDEGGGKSKKKLSRRKNNSKGKKKDDGDDNDPVVEQDLNSSDEELLTNRKARKRQNK